MTLERWDRLPADERVWWLERDRRQRSLHSCGHERHVCSDPERTWFPQLTVCYPTMVEESARAEYARLHEKRPWHDGSFSKWSEEPSATFRFHFQHGTHIWAADVDHGQGGDFLSGSPRANQREDN